jgi:hypothetical protein
MLTICLKRENDRTTECKGVILFFFLCCLFVNDLGAQGMSTMGAERHVVG